MNIKQKHFKALLKTIEEGNRLSEEEQDLFYTYLENPENIQLLEASINNKFYSNDLGTIEAFQKKQSLENLYLKINTTLDEAEQPTNKRKRFFLTKSSWAAVWVFAILLFGAAYYIFQQKPMHKVAVQGSHSKVESKITPGKNGAILTLDNGQQITLDSITNGLIDLAGNGKAMLANGKLNYNNTANNPQKSITYNTITTPKGRQFQLLLADGSKVWLNAASSIRFPTTFIGKERLVEIKGEAYFEVVHNSKMPFRVKTSNQIIEDLGTHFNVKAYQDETETKTTLLEGAVKIHAQDKQIILQPGEQLKMQADRLTVQKVNTDDVVAWTTGFFAFENASLDDIMRQIGRWYNVSIEYKNGEKSQHFSGKIDRSLPLKDVLSGLQFTKAHFKIDEQNRKIIVLS